MIARGMLQGVADVLTLTRNALRKLALDRPELLFKNGGVCYSKLAKALEVSSSTVNRIFNGYRNTAKASPKPVEAVGEYQPSPRLLEGIRRLMGGHDQADAMKFILKPELRIVTRRTVRR